MKSRNENEKKEIKKEIRKQKRVKSNQDVIYYVLSSSGTLENEWCLTNTILLCRSVTILPKYSTPRRKQIF